VSRSGSPRRRKLVRWLVALVCASVAVNAWVCLHAWALTHFAAAGTRMLKPEELSRWQKIRTLLLGAKVPRPTNTRSPADLGLEFETRTLPSTNGVMLEAWLVRQTPSAGWVYLFHGFGESKQQMLLAMQRFHDLGFNTLAIDFRASGGSTGGNLTTIGYAEAEDVAATVRWGAAELGATAPILYGFSMGSAAVLRAVGRLRTPAAALIVEAPFDRMLSTVENRFHMMGVPSFPMAHLLVFWGGVLSGFPGLAHNPADYGAGVTCPTLLIHGQNDDRVTVAQATGIYHRLTGPKQLAVVPGVGHEATEKLPAEAWREMVGAFLKPP
jgi:uncharacterized protein